MKCLEIAKRHGCSSYFSQVKVRQHSSKRLLAQRTSTLWLCTSPDMVCTRLGEWASGSRDPCYTGSRVSAGLEECQNPLHPQHPLQMTNNKTRLTLLHLHNDTLIFGKSFSLAVEPDVFDPAANKFSRTVQQVKCHLQGV